MRVTIKREEDDRQSSLKSGVSEESSQQSRYIFPNRLKEQLPLAIGVLAVWLAGCVADLYTRPLSALQL